jgi:hypothetical protein
MNENQKKTTDEYRNNWDSIFKKKEYAQFKGQNYGAYQDENGNTIIGVKPEEKK